MKKRQKPLMQRALTAVCSALLATAVTASEPEPYYIAVSHENFLPYTWIQDGVFYGADRALLDAFAKTEQLKLIYLTLPRTRALELMQSGMVDLIYPDDHHWAYAVKREMPILYSNYGMKNQAGYFRLREAQCDAELSSIGAQPSWNPVGYEEQIRAGDTTLRSYSTPEQLLEAGINGEVDALFSERSILGAHIEREPRYQGLEFCPSLPTSRGKLRLSTIKHPDLLELFNGFLESHPDKIDAIKEKYRLP